MSDSHSFDGSSAASSEQEPVSHPGDWIDEGHVHAEMSASHEREKIRAQMQHLRHLVNRLPGAVYRCTYDTEWCSLFMGAGFLDICGIPPETLDPAGRSFRDVVVDDDIPHIQAVVQEAVAKNDYYSIEYRIRDNDGRVRWVEDHGRPYIVEGTVQWLDGLLLDVTERKKAQQSLQRMNETLEETVETRTQEVRALAAELAVVEQHERSQIAHTIHDELQQFLYGLQVQTKMLVRSIQAHPDVDTEGLPVDPSQVEHVLEQAIQTTRGLTVDLSPPVLDSDGLLEALQWLRSHMESTHDLHVVLNGDLSDDTIPDAIRMVLFQAVRELLLNVHHHAGVDRAVVDMQRTEDAVILHVVDEGAGFDVDRLSTDAGHGIRTSTERLRLLGGDLTIDSNPGAGTRCTLRLPNDRLHDAPSMPPTTHVHR